MNLDPGTFVAIWFALLFVMNALPAIIVFGSNRAVGNDRVLWIVAVLFTSWAGFLAFMVVTTLKPEGLALKPPPTRR